VVEEKKRIFAEHGIQNTGFYHTMSLIKGKYKLPILYCLYLNGTTRYNELKRLMETATFRSLTNALKGLEEDGLIIRKEYAQIPPKVEYSLSELGQSLTPVLEVFCVWGEEHKKS
jgi:DNA-binding HxlR family transcriptional regulator